MSSIRFNTSVVHPTLLYISSEAVIPAKAGIQPGNTGFRVKPGMTIKVKGLLTQDTREGREIHEKSEICLPF
jgi:hypothetical protein